MTTDNPKIGIRLTFSLMAVVGAVTFASTYFLLRTDRVSHKLSAVNQVYIPSLKHVNLVAGKWASYRKSVDQYIQFGRWGEKNLELGRPRLHLKRMLEADLTQLKRFTTGKNGPLIRELVSQISAVADREPARLAELAAVVRARHLEDAAKVYMELRRDQGALSHSLTVVTRDLETAVDELQLAADRELHENTLIMLVLLVGSLVFSLAVSFRMRRWLQPIIAWRLAASAMARHIASSGFTGLRDHVQLPQTTRSTPPEMVLLTREFANMATTVMEHEKTIHAQKAKLENLNQHLKQQNEVLRKLGSLNERILNAMNAGVLVIDAAGKVEQFNERFCQILGAPRATVPGAEAKTLLTGFDAGLWERLLRAAEPLVERRVKRSDGQTLNIDVQLLPADERGGKGLVLSFEDVTALAVSEERLAHAEKLVLAGQMSAQVAHEVRNPLNAMMLQLEMLEEDLPAGEQRATSLNRVRQISEQVERLERLTRHYLNVGRGVDHDSERCMPVDLHELLENTLDFCSAEIQARGVMVDLKFNAGNPVVSADPDRVTQVLLNLLHYRCR